jgi:hypothetical protein
MLNDLERNGLQNSPCLHLPVHVFDPFHLLNHDFMKLCVNIMPLEATQCHTIRFPVVSKTSMVNMRMRWYFNMKKSVTFCQFGGRGLGYAGMWSWHDIMEGDTLHKNITLYSTCCA